MKVLLFFFICYMAIALLLIGLTMLIVRSRMLRFSRENIIGIFATGLLWLPILIYTIFYKDEN